MDPIDQHARATSLELRRIYADLEDAKTRAQFQPLKDEWAGRDLSRDGAPLSLAEMVENIDQWVRGDVS